MIRFFLGLLVLVAVNSFAVYAAVVMLGPFAGWWTIPASVVEGAVVGFLVGGPLYRGTVLWDD